VADITTEMMATLPMWARIEIVGLRDQITELRAGRGARIANLEAENAQLRSDLAAVAKARDGFRDAMRERSRR